MAEFKCICCGHIKESEKECTCPECGYKMFETPYDRKDMLRKEITRFVSCLRLTELDDDSFYYFRNEEKKTQSKSDEEPDIISKAEDDNRFPSFNSIRDYACAAQKTELFLERLSASLEQIKKYLAE